MFISKNHNVSESTSRSNLTGLIYVGISPNGEEIEFTSHKEFAEKYNLCKSVISACVSGIRKQHKGWKFRVKE